MTYQIDPLDDAHTDLGVLANLIDAAVAVLCEMHYGQEGGGRNRELDHVHAIVSMAHEEAERITDKLEKVIPDWRRLRKQEQRDAA